MDMQLAFTGDLFGAKAAPPKDMTVDALGFLITYVKEAKGQSFSAEHVTLAAAERGIVFDDMRQWGAVFLQAVREKIIRRSDVLFRRSMGHGTMAPGWVGV